jgi:hypothetical protein
LKKSLLFGLRGQFRQGEAGKKNQAAVILRAASFALSGSTASGL